MFFNRKIIISLILVLFCCMSTSAQNASDEALLLNTDFKPRNTEREVFYGFSENPSKFLSYNPVYHILSGSMWLYQKYISSQLASDCRYVPSCSEYSKLLIKDFGMTKGVFCSADRLMRCFRVAIAGIPQSEFDPVDGKIHENTDRYSFKR